MSGPRAVSFVPGPARRDHDRVRRGQLLIATPLLEDPNFFRTVVFLTSTAEGAAGVILNRPSDIPVGAVLPNWEQAAAPPVVVHFGGPVAVDHAIALGAGLHPEMVTDEIGIVDIEDSPQLAATGTIRVFAGYAGWGLGQLEAEIAEGAWFLAEGLPEDVVDPAPETLWRRVLSRQPAALRRYATYPDDPRLN